MRNYWNSQPTNPANIPGVRLRYQESDEINVFLRPEASSIRALVKSLSHGLPSYENENARNLSQYWSIPSGCEVWRHRQRQLTYFKGQGELHMGPCCHLTDTLIHLTPNTDKIWRDMTRYEVWRDCGSSNLFLREQGELPWALANQ